MPARSPKRSCRRQRHHASATTHPESGIARQRASRRQAMIVSPPGRVGGRKGFCSRAIPGPGPSQNPALCGSPPTKCQARIPTVLRKFFSSLSVVAVRGYPATSTHSRFGQRGPGRAVPSLSSLPCWVVPPPKTRQSVEPPASSSSSPLRGTASPCLSIPARHPLRRWVPFSLGFAHGRYPYQRRVICGAEGKGPLHDL